MKVRVSHDLVHWVRFFLTGVLQTAIKGKRVFQQILILRTHTEQSILKLGKRAVLAKHALL